MFSIFCAVSFSATFIGCYKDNSDRALPNYPTHSKEMTVDKCLEHCHSFDQKYAGMQNRNKCFCGDAMTIYDRYGRDDIEYCNTLCQGDIAQFCGGSWRNSVYILGKIFQ